VRAFVVAVPNQVVSRTAERTSSQPVIIPGQKYYRFQRTSPNVEMQSKAAWTLSSGGFVLRSTRRFKWTIIIIASNADGCAVQFCSPQNKSARVARMRYYRHPVISSVPAGALVPDSFRQTDSKPASYRPEYICALPALGTDVSINANGSRKLRRVGWRRP
jgi:hypothetical protein